jgi:hypothetical protein
MLKRLSDKYFLQYVLMETNGMGEDLETKYVKSPFFAPVVVKMPD